MPMTIEADARILGGLPVVAVGIVWPAEPDIGCGPMAELQDIQWPTGQSIPTHMWERLSQNDIYACHDALLEKNYNG